MARPSDRPLSAEDATIRSGSQAPPPAPPAAAAWRPGTTIDDRYRIEAELGRGAMGVVYRATEIWLDRTVALKVIAPELLRDSTAPVGLHREAKALAAIRDEHVVRVHAFGVHQGSYFFVMEYVRGRSLKEILAEHQAHGMVVPVHRTLTVLAQIAEGIEAVHGAGLVHRDIKPSNIIIEEDTGRPVLVDFGLVTTGTATPASVIVGTPLYMAPEQTGLAAIPAAISARTDVYALACTAFEMLAGRPPFQGDDSAELRRLHAVAPPPALSSIRPELAACDPVFRRALAKTPSERQETCVALAAELTVAATRGARPGSPPRAPRRRRCPSTATRPCGCWSSTSIPSSVATRRRRCMPPSSATARISASRSPSPRVATTPSRGPPSSRRIWCSSTTICPGSTGSRCSRGCARRAPTPAWW